MVKNVVKLIDLVLTICFVGHLFAIIWLQLAKFSLEEPKSENLFGLKSFVDYDWDHYYLRSYYFSIVTMTTVGYGDMSPKNESEIFFSIISNLFSCGLIAYTINSIGNLIIEIKNRNKILVETINTIN